MNWKTVIGVIDFHSIGFGFYNLINRVVHARFASFVVRGIHLILFVIIIIAGVMTFFSVVKMHYFRNWLLLVVAESKMNHFFGHLKRISKHHHIDRHFIVILDFCFLSVCIPYFHSRNFNSNTFFLERNKIQAIFRVYIKICLKLLLCEWVSICIRCTRNELNEM